MVPALKKMKIGARMTPSGDNRKAVIPPSPAWEQYRQTAWDLFEMAEYGKTGNTFADFRANRIDAMLKAIWDAAHAAARRRIEELEQKKALQGAALACYAEEQVKNRAEVAALSAQVEDGRRVHLGTLAREQEWQATAREQERRAEAAEAQVAALSTQVATKDREFKSVLAAVQAEREEWQRENTELRSQVAHLTAALQGRPSKELYDATIAEFRAQVAQEKDAAEADKGILMAQILGIDHASMAQPCEPPQSLNLLEVIAYQRGWRSVHDSAVAMEMTRRINAVAERCSKAEAELAQLRQQLTEKKPDRTVYHHYFAGAKLTTCGVPIVRGEVMPELNHVNCEACVAAWHRLGAEQEQE